MLRLSAKVRTVLFISVVFIFTPSCTQYFSPMPGEPSFGHELQLFKGKFSLAELITADSVSANNNQTILFQNNLVDTAYSFRSLKPQDSAYQITFNPLSSHFPLPVAQEPEWQQSKSQLNFLQTFAPDLVASFSNAQSDSLFFKGFTNVLDTLYLPQHTLSKLLSSTKISSGTMQLTATNNLNIPIHFKVGVFSNNTLVTTAPFLLEPGSADSNTFLFNGTVLGTSTTLKVFDVAAPGRDSALFIDNLTASLNFHQILRQLHAESGNFYPKDTVIATDTIDLSFPIADKAALSSISAHYFKVEMSHLLDSIGDQISMKEVLFDANTSYDTKQNIVIASSQAFPTELYSQNSRFTNLHSGMKYAYEISIISGFPIVWSTASNVSTTLSPKVGGIYCAEFNQDKTLVFQSNSTRSNPLRNAVSLSDYQWEKARMYGSYTFHAWGKADLKQETETETANGSTVYLADTFSIAFNAADFSDSSLATKFNWSVDETDHADVADAVDINSKELRIKSTLTLKAPFGVLFNKKVPMETYSELPLYSNNASLSINSIHSIDFYNGTFDSLLVHTDSLTLRATIASKTIRPLHGNYALLLGQDTLLGLPINTVGDSLYSSLADTTLWELEELTRPLTGHFNAMLKDTLIINSTDSLEMIITGTFHNPL